MASIRNPYEVLGVERTADINEIKSAYRRLAKLHHPDRNAGNKQSEEKFKEISEAYAILRDPDSRSNYDRFGHQQKYQQPDFNNVDWQSVFKDADINIDFDMPTGMPKSSNLLFKLLFGAVNKMIRQSGILPGENRELNIKINLNDARSGAIKRIKVPGPSICSHCKGSGIYIGKSCDRCQGSGFLKSGEELELSVPKGVKRGTKLRLKAMGGPGTPPGDVIVQIDIKLPGNAKMVDRDIFIDLPLTPLEAAKGKNVRVLGLDIEIEKNMKDGQLIRVQGGGIAGGDLVVKIVLDVWQGLWRNLKSKFVNTMEVVR